MFSVLKFLIEIIQLYNLKDEELGDRAEMIKCRSEGVTLPVVFQEVFMRLMKELIVTHSQEQTTQVVTAKRKRKVRYCKRGFRLFAKILELSGYR